MKRTKFNVYINGNYVDTFNTIDSAESWVRMNKRQDRYERDVLGYANALPVYEIKIA